MSTHRELRSKCRYSHSQKTKYNPKASTQEEQGCSTDQQERTDTYRTSYVTEAT